MWDVDARRDNHYNSIYIDNKFYSITEKQFFGSPEKGRIAMVFLYGHGNLLG
jgi:hypothetical protein